MGVAGCGKTSVGLALAERLGLPYADGDDLHPAGNIAKMTRGEPLTDADRWPWLTRVGQVLRDRPGIIGCSALKRSYRDLIRAEAGGELGFIYLAGSPAVIAARMEARRDHFMPASLLDSQFAALEPPGLDEDAITIDIDQPLDALVEALVARLTP